MRNNDTNLATIIVSHLQHVTDKGPVTLALGRYTSPETVVWIAGSFLGSPFIKRERRIGHNSIKLHQFVVDLQLRIAQRVAPTDYGIVESMQKHVHHRQSPCTAINLLTIEREVVIAHFFASLNQQRARTTSNITDTSTWLTLRQFGQQCRNFCWREEVSSLFASLPCKGRNKVHVGIANNIVVLQMRFVQI